MGQSYLLTSPQGGQSQLLEAVERVDSAMCKIRDAGKVRARDRIAVLAALNLAFDLAGLTALQAFPSPVAIPARTSAGNGADHSAYDGQPDATLGQLLQRLDAALGEDGNLI